MLDKPSIQDLLEVQRDFDLPSPVLVEKDWHVVGALAAITTTDVKPFRLAKHGMRVEFTDQALQTVYQQALQFQKSRGLERKRGGIER